MRKVKIKDEKLKKILTERGLIFKEINEVNEKIVKLDKERKKLGYKMDKLKDKTSKVLKKHKIKVGEFEVITQVGLEDKEPTLTVVDQIEETKKRLREKKDEEK